MAPRKREEKAKSETASLRVTRSMSQSLIRETRSLSGWPAKKATAPRKLGRGKAKKKKEVRTENVEEEAAVKVEMEEKTAEEIVGVVASKKIVIEHCKQCNSFKTRASQVKKGLEKGVPGITVELNPEKPRRGCFEIREDGGETFTSLLDMRRPFAPMKALDMEEVIAEIIKKIK